MISEDCAGFLMGLLKARETERIGAGPAGFIQIQKHSWFEQVDWEATLRRQIPAPYIPPRHPDGAADVGVDFAREDVSACTALNTPCLHAMLALCRLHAAHAPLMPRDR